MSRGLWVKISVDMLDDPKIVGVGVNGELLFIRAICWAKKQNTPGTIPVVMIPRIALGIDSPLEVAERLCEAGLWCKVGDEFLIVSWTKWQTDHVAEKSDGGVLGNHVRWHKRKKVAGCPHCESGLSLPIGDRSVERSDTDRTSDRLLIAEQELEQEQETLSLDTPAGVLCSHLAELMVLNGCKQPKISQKWIKDMDALLRLDKHSEDEVRGIIDWCQTNEFWKANILSPGKLREKFDQLVLKSGTKTGNVNQTDGAWEQVTNEVRRIGSYGTPVFDDPAILAAVRRVGWRNICQSTKPEAMKAAFISAYVSERQQH